MNYENKIIIFDIGANSGEDGIKLADYIKMKFQKECIIFAFEPNPRLAKILIEKYNSDNYIVIEKAVCDFNGKATFNLAEEDINGQTEGGVSSLLEFNDNLETSWEGRTDLKVSSKIEVDVIRLDTFIEEYNIPRINFLHIDTQGVDLRVLESLGRYLYMLEYCCVEVPITDELKLYKNQHSIKDILKFIKENNYEIYNVFMQQNEDNIYFRKQGKNNGNHSISL